MRKRARTCAKAILGVGILVLALLIGVFYINNVDNALTKEDTYYINKIVSKTEANRILLPDRAFEDEIQFIKKTQQAVLAIAPENRGLIEGTPREPKQLYTYHYGLCYDRSRVIVKVLRANGFKTRHISVYSLSHTVNTLKAITSSGTESHALSEVLTAKGWLFIDSNDIFLGLDNNNNPVTMDLLQQKGFDNIQWTSYNNLNYQVIYQKKFTYLYGLYSRHGKFYEPYTFIPDLNWAEFLQNFFC